MPHTYFQAVALCRAAHTHNKIKYSVGDVVDRCEFYLGEPLYDSSKANRVKLVADLYAKYGSWCDINVTHYKA